MIFPVSGFCGIGIGKGMTWLQLLSCWPNGACDFCRVGLLHIPWRAASSAVRAVRVTARHCCSLCSDPVLGEVTGTKVLFLPQCYACPGSKKSLSPGIHPYFKDISSDTAESAVAKKQGLENFAFDRIESQTAFCNSSSPSKEHQAQLLARHCRAPALPSLFWG